jgi:hypothetical protein
MKAEMVKLNYNGAQFKVARTRLAEIAVAALFAGALPQAANVAPPAPGAVPALGEYWPSQGGINGGLVAARGDVPAHYLIFAAKDAGSFEWGPRNTDLPGTSKTDGKLNTELMCFDENDYPASDACAEYAVDGHNDFYLPAAAELYQGWLNCPEVFAQDTWYWSSSQRSAYGAFSVHFDVGPQDYGVKDGELRVRPVRRFFI